MRVSVAMSAKPQCVERKQQVITAQRPPYLEGAHSHATTDDPTRVSLLIERVLKYWRRRLHWLRQRCSTARIENAEIEKGVEFCHSLLKYRNFSSTAVDCGKTRQPSRFQCVMLHGTARLCQWHRNDYHLL